MALLVQSREVKLGTVLLNVQHIIVLLKFDHIVRLGLFLNEITIRGTVPYPLRIPERLLRRIYGPEMTISNSSAFRLFHPDLVRDTLLAI